MEDGGLEGTVNDLGKLELERRWVARMFLQGRLTGKR